MKHILKQSLTSLGQSLIRSSHKTQDQADIIRTLERHFANAEDLNPENITALCAYFPQINGRTQAPQLYISYSANHKTPLHHASWHELITT